MRDLMNELKRLRTDEERLAWFKSLTVEEQQALLLQVNAIVSEVVDTVLPEMEAMFQHFRAVLEPWARAALVLAENAEQSLETLETLTEREE